MKQCEFFLLRYVPDAVKDEFVNIGVVLLERENQFAEVRFTRDWSRVRCLDPQADTDTLQALESELRERLHDSPVPRDQMLEKLQDSLSNSLQITASKGLLTESPPLELEKLASYYLDRALPRREGRVSVRQRIVSGMQSAFEAAGVWSVLNKEIPASRYTHPGDPLKIDCGYRPNGVIRLFHAVALSTEPNTAKVLAFTFPMLSEGIARMEKATTELTAIVEDDLDRQEESTKFALDTLQRNSIQVAALRQIPEIAERARVELRL
jgi:hypothetical protein